MKVPVTVRLYAFKAKETVRYLTETLLTGPCLIGRHKWAIEPAQTINGKTFPAFLNCPRCCTTSGLADPAPDYPENLDVLLSDADEEWLAEMDAATWPDETDWEHTRDASARLARSTED